MGIPVRVRVPPSAPLFKAVAVTYCDGFSFLFRAVAKRGEKAPFGLKCAKLCQSAGSFTPKTDKALCLARHKQTILPPSAPPSRETAYPSLSGVLLPFSIHMPGAVSQAGQGETPPEPPNAQSARPAAPVRCRSPKPPFRMPYKNALYGYLSPSNNESAL